ncbi:o-succinylbenzoate synthase [Synechocystis sp. LKSZ1]|uniref:o-succinylbenzoate synthase n=1 Tax=Synechocystis sp. LKSZ1 TaxID=3144951 RepID=UPI00336C1D0D
MTYSVDYFPYHNLLNPPLQTRYGCWSIREGITLRLIDDEGRTGWGEIAPLPWFGTETLALALEFCQALAGQITAQQIEIIPAQLPCCQFAFGSALADLTETAAGPSKYPLAYCQLLPTGEAALDVLAQGLLPGVTTFKWKIAVQSFAVESALLLRLLDQLPPQGRLRLDANGGLDFATIQCWLALLDTLPAIEFLEQPLPPGQETEMQAFGQNFRTVLALDESVSSLAQLQQAYDQGWPGVYVLKAAIMGFPTTLAQWLEAHPLDAVFSSVLETAVARCQVLALARRYNHPQRAVGFRPIC